LGFEPAKAERSGDIPEVEGNVAGFGGIVEFGVVVNGVGATGVVVSVALELEGVAVTDVASK
uniref:RidA family protein n=1 Tax=Echinostoma caproni TaxID=27848 RepID=A0A183B698_9TREM